nr:TIGR00266 family protein [Argonema antarcticum]
MPKGEDLPVKYEIRYKPAFAAIFVTLSPGESMTAEAGAMTSMDGQMSMKTEFSGGFFSGLLKKFLGGESLFVNVFTNQTQQTLNLVLTQSAIGDIGCIELRGEREICFQPGAYIAHSPGVKMSVQWAGFKSWLSGEGLFKLKLKGNGQVFFGAYGGITKKRINGEFIVDTSHLVAYDPGIKMNIGMAGGLIGSVTSGEGLINRLSGEGEIYLQSRSIGGLVKYLRPKVF